MMLMMMMIKIAIFGYPCCV